MRKYVINSSRYALLSSLLLFVGSLLILSSVATRVQSQAMPDPYGPHTFEEILPLLECPDGSVPDKSDSTGYIKYCDVQGTDEDIYPTPKGVEPIVVRGDELTKEVNIAYPDWYRGTAEGFEADATSHHYYYDLIGDGVEPPAYQTENLYCAPFFLKPGKTYFAHNHPTREIYYVYGGQAHWYAGSKEFDVKEGDMIIHPPYINHGLTNTGDDYTKALACWWRMPSDPEKVMNYRGLPLNPCLVENEETSEGYPQPIGCPADR